MSDLLLRTLLGAWTTLCAMAPYLLAGFLAAGVLSLFIRPEWVERHLGGRGFKPIVKASLFGVPLPLCSCGVIPVAAGLRRHGASRGATVAFLLSTPQTGADNILVVLSLLGPVFALFSPVAAFATGLLGGAVVTLAERADPASAAPAPACADDCCASSGARRSFAAALHYGFVTLARDVAAPLAVGLLIAGLLTTLVPPDFFTGALGTGLTGILVMILLGIPVYVCSAGSIPIAAALMLKGVSPGAALAFLITGPVTNAATIATVWKLLGRRTAFLYLATVFAAAIGLGLLLNAVFTLTGISPAPPLADTHVHCKSPGLFSVLSAVVLLGVLAASFFGRRSPHEDKLAGQTETTPAVRLTISGMTCDHCAQSVRNALLKLPGVREVRVDLSAGQAAVTGEGLDTESLCRAVRSAGYDAAVLDS